MLYFFIQMYMSTEKYNGSNCDRKSQFSGILTEPLNPHVLKLLPELFQSRCNFSAINVKLLSDQCQTNGHNFISYHMSTQTQAQLSMPKWTQALKMINAKLMGTILSSINVNTDTWAFKRWMSNQWTRSYHLSMSTRTPAQLVCFNGDQINLST